jgi:hypothetical protein
MALGSASPALAATRHHRHRATHKIANTSTTTSTTTSSSTSSTTAGSSETALTGTTLSSASAAAIAAVPGGTVDRATTETDSSDTTAAYEVHVTQADGSHVVVIEDVSFKVLSTSAAQGHGNCGAGGPAAPTTSAG